MNKKWLIGLVLSSLLTSLHATCNNAPTSMALQQSIQSKNIDKAQELFGSFNDAVKNYLASCKDEVKKEEVNLMKLTFEQDIQDLDAELKKEKRKEKVNCAELPEDSAFTKAFAGGDATMIHKHYSEYDKKVTDFLDYCTSHEEYEFVFEDSITHYETYRKWKKSTKQ